MPIDLGALGGKPATTPTTDNADVMDAIQHDSSQKESQADKIISQETVSTDGPTKVRDLLLLLDNMVIEECRIAIADLTRSKECIGNMFLELQKSPQLEELLVDKDIHNIMVFMQMTKNQVKEKLAVVKVKRKAKGKKAIMQQGILELLAKSNSDDTGMI